MASSGLEDLYGPPAPAPQAKVAKSRNSATSARSGLGDLYGGVEAALPPSAAGGLHAARVAIPKALELLDRPRQATQAAIAGHDWLGALVHGADPAQQDANRAAVRAKVGAPGPADRAQLHGLRGGVDDLLTDTLTDPVSYASAGVAPLLKLLGRGAAAGARGAAKVAPELAKDLGEAAQRVGDALTYGGSVKRELGADAYHGAIAADNRRAARADEAARRLRERFAPIRALPDAERVQVYQVLNGERDARGLSPHLASAVAQARRLTQDAAALRATETGSRKLAYGGGHLNQAEARLRQRGPTPGAAATPNLFRYERDAGGQSLRGGTFYSHGAPQAAYGGAYEGLGGKKLLRAFASGKNVLDVRDPDGYFFAGAGPGLAAIEHFWGRARASALWAADNADDVEALGKALRDAGVPDHEVPAVLGAGTGAAIDRVAAQLARAAGHDAIHGRGDILAGGSSDYFALHPHAATPEAAQRGFQDALRDLEAAAETSKGVLTPRRGAGTERRLVGRVDRRYQLPAELREFAAPLEQGTLGAESVRARYLPAPHTGLAAGDRDAATFNDLVPRDAHALQREEFVVDPAQLAEHDAAFEEMLGSAGRQGAAGRLRDELGVQRGGNAPEPLVRLFERELPATGARRGLEQRLGERWRGLVNVPKNTVTTIGMKHGLVNVPALAAQSEGAGAAAEALAHGLRVSRMNPAERWEALRPGIEGGVVTPFEDRENPIVSALERIAPPLGVASRAANAATWSIDDAAKQAVFLRKYQRLRDQGVPHATARTRASAETLRELVDYRHASPVTRLLRNVAPFATFRTAIPGAIASSAARNPRRLMLYDRASQGGFTSGAVGAPDDRDPKRRVTISTPTADALEIPGEPWRYARATIADPLRVLLSAPAGVGGALGALSPKEQRLMRYFTYGQPLLPHRDRNGKFKVGFGLQSAVGDVPFGLGEYGLGALGASEFPPMDPLELLLGPTVGAHVR